MLNAHAMSRGIFFSKLDKIDALHTSFRNTSFESLLTPWRRMWIRNFEYNIFRMFIQYGICYSMQKIIWFMSCYATPCAHWGRLTKKIYQHCVFSSGHIFRFGQHISNEIPFDIDEILFYSLFLLLQVQIQLQLINSKWIIVLSLSARIENSIYILLARWNNNMTANMCSCLPLPLPLPQPFHPEMNTCMHAD